MERSALEVEARVEATHWWFVGRRELLARVLEGLPRVAGRRILDVGTGTGANLRLLNDLMIGEVEGVDLSDDAIRYCQEKELGIVRKGDIRDLPFEESGFHLVLAADVLEHVEDDHQAASELYRVLKPDGTAIVTVPAFESLWGLQDEVSHHKRRYRLHSLRRTLEGAGFHVQEAFYFNSLLFAPIWIARQAIRLCRVKLASENEFNSRLMNSILTAVFRCDVRLAPRLRPPFGVSIFAQATKRRLEIQRQ